MMQKWIKKLRAQPNPNEQIDTLSTIASAFSDFAKMPVSLPETIEIVDLLKRTALLYNNRSNIKMHIDTTSNPVVLCVCR